ncbi:MAG TPA: hypothetical protein VIT45_04980 [Allosphingosinicella sp.]
MKRSILMICLAALALLKSDPLRAEEGEDTFITRAAFAQGRLWILTYSGRLFSIGEHDHQSRLEKMDGEVRDFCVRDGRIMAAVGPRRGRGTWIIRGRANAGWAKLAAVPARREGLIGLSCEAGTMILTTHRLIDVSTRTARSLDLSDVLLPPQILAAFHADRGHLVVGFNRGEWGGGLRRIDRLSGEIEVIHDADGGCSGLLDVNCHPVHSIQRVPWKPACLIAAVGLVHFFPNGRLVEVCGKRIRLHYSRPVEIGAEEAGEAARGSEAFFGLVKSGESLWAAGTEGLYKLGDGRVETVPMPKFRRLDQFWVSFDIPELIVLVTRVNARASVSGGAPMLVAR